MYKTLNLLLLLQGFLYEVLSSCGVGLTEFTSGVCVKCQENCKTCKFGDFKHLTCSECKEGFTLISENSINVCTQSKNSKLN